MWSSSYDIDLTVDEETAISMSFLLAMTQNRNDMFADGFDHTHSLAFL